VTHTASPVKALISQNGINIPVDLGSQLGHPQLEPRAEVLTCFTWWQG